MENDNSRNEGAAKARGKALIKPLLIVLIIMGVLMAAIFGFQAFKGKMIGKFMAKSAAAPQSVATIKAKAASWQPQLQATGSLRAVRGADLSAQATGVVAEIKIESGKNVAAGAVLLRLRPNDDAAKLQQLQASEELAMQTLKRDQEQFQVQAVSQQTLDNDASTLKSDHAQVLQQQALIEEKTVRAPFAGRLGIRQVDLGQYLAAGTTIVTLQALDPILIDFYLPQQALAHVQRGQSVSARVDTYPDTTFSGEIESINSKVDSTSRNVQIRASFPNRDLRLMPGMYATVNIASGDAHTYVTVPSTAITYSPYGDTVYVVQRGGNDEADHSAGLVAQQRFVTLGETRGDQVSILSGIKQDEEIVAAGQLKLRNGISVAVNNSVTVPDDTNPTPPNE